MKKNFLRISGLFLLMFFFFISSALNIKAATKTQTITSLPEPTWIEHAGMSKGKYHDRQDLGFILRENTVLKVRQTNPNFTGKLTLRLLGYDSQMEKSVTVGSNWTTVSADSPLVPFVDTPYGKTSATLEYEIEDTRAQKPLPIYTYKGDQTAFFKTWDQYDGNFALIKGKDFQLLIPKSDKEAVRKLTDYKNLDELIDHYTEIFAFYNKMAGFDGSTPTNVNGQNRYFLKADAHGSGGAYYSDQWAANTSRSVKMWLTKLDWATLHEIAHGYQAGFDGVGMYTGEVSNNLFGVQYQYTKYGKKADQIGWLFNYGKKDAVENSLYKTLVTDKGGYADVDLRGKLILLTMLKQKAGDSSFTKMYQEYRQLANKPGFKKSDYPLPDLMNQVYSENSHQDFTPVLQRWGLSVNGSQQEKNRAANYPAVASLADVVPQAQLTTARKLLDKNILINSNFEMVQNKDIAPLNLTGNLTLNLNTDDIQNLKGTTITLKDGAKVVASQPITAKTITFKKVPNGIYTLAFSGKAMQQYMPNKNYVYVKEANNNTALTLKNVSVSSLTNQELDFLGVNDNKFATLKTNLNQHQATLAITNTTPHSYYKGQKYAQITVKDSNNKTTFTKTIEGTGVTKGNETFALNPGDTLEIYHAETKNRLTSTDNIVDKTNNMNKWTVTKFGLKNNALNNDPQQILINKISSQCSQLMNQQDQQNIPLAQSPVKKALLADINLLDEPYQSTYKQMYALLFQ